jgi:hypothetical protein
VTAAHTLQADLLMLLQLVAAETGIPYEQIDLQHNGNTLTDQVTHCFMLYYCLLTVLAQHLAIPIKTVVILYSNYIISHITSHHCLSISLP